MGRRDRADADPAPAFACDDDPGEAAAYARKDQAETAVLFELIAERYERRSLIVTSNHPLGEWDKIFPDPAMTVAAIDRLVHHATILEFNTESYRRRASEARKAAG